MILRVNTRPKYTDAKFWRDVDFKKNANNIVCDE